MDNLFSKFGTTYETIQEMISSIARKIAGNHSSDEYLEELESEGWIIVLETIPEYVPGRGVKLTTFLWMAVNGGMLRYALKRNKRQRIFTGDDAEMHEISTESVPKSGVFNDNPYLMEPDVMYEKAERTRIWREMRDQNEEDIDFLLKKTPKSADQTVRKELSRYRKRKLLRLQASVQCLLS